MFQPSDKVFLDAPDIYTFWSSTKYHLGPYMVEKWVGPMLYHLKLLLVLWKLYLVFHVIKLTSALENPIPRRHSKPPLDPIIIDEEEEWEVEKILDSC